MCPLALHLKISIGTKDKDVPSAQIVGAKVAHLVSLVDLMICTDADPTGANVFLEWLVNETGVWTMFIIHLG